MNNNNLKHNILILSDSYSGTLWWRFQQMIDAMKFIRHDIVFTNITVLNMPFDVLYYNRFDIIVCHLTLNTPADFLFKAKRDGLLNATLFWSQDDMTDPEIIADYILPKETFRTPKVKKTIEEGIEASDFVITTTPFLRQKISEHYKKPIEKILLWPNLVSSTWMGNMFSPEFKKQSFKKHKQKKIQALFTGGLNHLSFDCKCQDDLSMAEDTIKQLGDSIQFKIMASDCKRIQQFNGKLTPTGYCDLIHFPQFYHQQNADVMIAPLIDSEFNKCKSNIKVLEASMLGVVPFAQRLEPYIDWMPDNLLFSDSQELTEKLKDFSTWSADRFESTIIQNYNRFLKAQDYYGRQIDSFFADMNYKNLIELLETTPTK